MVSRKGNINDGMRGCELFPVGNTQNLALVTQHNVPCVLFPFQHSISRVLSARPLKLSAQQQYQPLLYDKIVQSSSLNTFKSALLLVHVRHVVLELEPYASPPMLMMSDIRHIIVLYPRMYLE
jgi:hypothetical protein